MMVAMHAKPHHIPVLQKEVCMLLAPQKGDAMLDCTLGAGGHAQLFLQCIGPTGTLIGLDADRENLAIAQSNLKEWADSCTFIHANFREILHLTIPPVDILFADLGLSSMHINTPERGFTFHHETELDMRFNREEGIPAWKWIEQKSEEELAQALKDYGELQQSRKLARLLKEQAVRTTTDVAECVAELFRWRGKKMLPQVFQALRIAVNDELGALCILLKEGPRLLKSKGRMGIISFHSLEDRMVKQAFRDLTAPPSPYTLLTKKPIRSSEEEVRRNPRSRSAHLRAIQRSS
ncbi:16S rRNA (cytosine(1402)-N(4))-methyltransferase [Candidatus Peregrinibacteria bacterium CG22_combo_CG10-13_8_21_14_all_49_11]|nr:MAG: 16S rRNA (cytosine(1402)-N(4))-methyltransferase [Candidatus Peregrinibacteria bacterium CG22_combo_CG10-13_8_21_14_all_49_11]